MPRPMYIYIYRPTLMSLHQALKCYIIVDYLIVRQCQITTPLETRIASLPSKRRSSQGMRRFCPGLRLRILLVLLHWAGSTFLHLLRGLLVSEDATTIAEWCEVKETVASAGELRHSSPLGSFEHEAPRHTVRLNCHLTKLVCTGAESILLVLY